MGIVGKSVIRVDAVDKVTGKAKFTSDFFDRHMLVGKVLGSAYAHAVIKAVHKEKAQALEGVYAVLSYEDTPQIAFTPCGHPFSFTPHENHNMHILASKARYVGDPVAAVVAETEEIAEKAISLIEVEYEVLPAVFDIEKALEPGAPLIHENRPGNIVDQSGEAGDKAQMQVVFASAPVSVQNRFHNAAVKHSHLELCSTYAYMDGKGRITVVTPTQAPFLAKKRTAQALNLPDQKLRFIKPYVGGGFGNRQDALFEPLNALMTMKVQGKPVRLSLTREEGMIMTRTRYEQICEFAIAADDKGNFLTASHRNWGNGGAYAIHNHAITSSSSWITTVQYRFPKMYVKPVTVYTNLPSGGAMRAYGVPQGNFAMEASVDDIAVKLGMDPIEIRLKNLMTPQEACQAAGFQYNGGGLVKCLEKARILIDWDEKKKRYSTQEYKFGRFRKGLGVAAFTFTSSTYPVNAEISGARLRLLDGGGMTLQIGATEIGQGSDTVFTQMAAEVLDCSMERIYVESTQNTDISPFDCGAYATRQTYVCGMAVVEAAQELKKKIIDYAAKYLKVRREALDLKNDEIVYKDSNETAVSYEELSLHAFYDKEIGQGLIAESHVSLKHNGGLFGCTVVEVEVDTQLCRVEIKELYSVHDSGKIINHRTAEGQVHGGNAMSIGYGLMEEMLYDSNGKARNNNLLDYKFPTIMDIPEIKVEFMDEYHHGGPLGAGGLGEPPNITPAPAIRNAILDATGVAFYETPISPKKMFEGFKKAGLIH